MKKKILSMSAALLMAVVLLAQDRILSMEEAVLGYELRPQTRSIQWRGNLDVF